MKARYKERLRLQGKVVFTNGSQTGEGRVVDLTSPGCLIESAGIAVPEGQSLQLNISLLAQAHPLVVTLGVVRWTDGTRFGVEFIKMDPANRLALNHFLAQHLPHQVRARTTRNSFGGAVGGKLASGDISDGERAVNGIHPATEQAIIVPTRPMKGAQP